MTAICMHCRKRACVCAEWERLLRNVEVSCGEVLKEVRRNRAVAVDPVPIRHIDALIEQGRHEEREAILALLRRDPLASAIFFIGCIERGEHTEEVST